MTEKHSKCRLILPTFLDGGVISAACDKCKAKIDLLAETQNSYLAGKGLGHKCSECGMYYIVGICSECKAPLFIDSDQWEAILESGVYKCSDCGEKLKVTIRKTKLGISGVMAKHELTAYSNTALESHFLECLRSSKCSEVLEKIAQVHGAAWMRLKVAIEEIKLLKNTGIQGIAMANQPFDLIDEGSDKCDAESVAFKVSNSLISCLELLAQETTYILDLKWPECRVSFYRAAKNKDLFDRCPEIGCHIGGFVDSSVYKYLSKLRNCIHHRSSIPIAIESTHLLETPGSICPRYLKSEHVAYLPDNPDSGTGYTFDCRKEMISTFEEMVNSIKDFRLTLYALLADVK
ncbi:hypothetical protein [Sedimenticola sp.]|uniref:hypothetical protein n=1 Tax=Sedimenticola sp. TaxID=1940285 RepID=UPI003D14F6D7